MKLMFNSGSYKLIIPKALVEAKDWKDKDELEIKIVDGGLLVKLKEEV